VQKENAMKVLIGYDGSATANEALRDLELAGIPVGAEVRMVSAVPPLLPLEDLAPDAETPGWYVAAYAEAKLNLRRTEKEALRVTEKACSLLQQRFPDWSIEAETCFDAPAKALLKRAEKWKPDLLVVGSHGWTALGRLLLGSVAEKVLSHAHGNVRIARRSASRSGGKARAPRLLIGYDGSKHANAVIEQVAARAWPEGTQARLVAAADLQMRVDEILRPLSKPAKGKTVHPSPWPWIEKKIEKASAKLAKLGIKTESIVLQGDPRKAILAEAKSFRADCIFVGSRGLAGVERFLLGSASSAVCAHAPCTVEVIRKITKG
jgi:nucleotide-binding universal stress UspA family protein